jgi:UDP-N-acetylmuramyl tripeptide synthase
MNLFHLLRALPSHQIQNPDTKRQDYSERDIDITRVTDKSSEVIPGALFVAIPGLNVDGAQFIPEAIQRGAVAIVTQSQTTNYRLPLVTVPDTRSPLPIFLPPLRLSIAQAARHRHHRHRRQDDDLALTAAILKAAGHKVGTITTVSAQIGAMRSTLAFTQRRRMRRRCRVSGANGWRGD